MRRAGLILPAVIAAALPSSAWAQEWMVNAPAGRAGEVAATIARQTGTSIVISDGDIAGRRIGAIRGRLSTKEAVERLARAAKARAVPAGPSGWRLVPVRVAHTAPSRSPVQGRTELSGISKQEAPALPIVVVSSKRDLLLEEVPGQVSLLDGQDLTFGGVGGTEKITQRLATVSSTHLGSGRNKLFIRGIADSSFTGPTQATVGQYFGDLRISYNAPDPDLRLNDLDRVEVMEGPQGTLYGAGSLGGIIRLVPNQPEMGVTYGSAMVGGSATEHGAIGGDASATFNLPLVGDRAALRLALDAETQGGYIDKPLLGKNDVNRTSIYAGRAAVRIDLGSDWAIDLVGIGQTTRGDDSQYADRNGEPLDRDSQVVEGFDADYAQGQFVVSGRFGDVRLRSSTGATWQDLDERFDASLPDGPPRLFTQNNDITMIANETRLWQPLGDRFGWLAGVSLTHNSTTLTRTLDAEELRSAATGVRNKVDEATLYGEASLRLFEGLIATGGARITHSRLGGTGEDITPVLLAALSDVTAKRSETVFLPSASLVAMVMPETSLYLRYQEGFRPGGLSIDGPFVRRFRNDQVYTFEFGGRHGRPGAGPFDIAASVSFTRWNDIQADFIDSSGFPSTANIGNGRIWSATLVGGVRIAPGLRVDAGMSYNDSRVDEPAFRFVPATEVPQLVDPGLPLSSETIDRLVGQQTLAAASQVSQVPNIANVTARIGFDYARPLTDNLLLTAQGRVNYIGKSRLGVGPELGAPQGDYVDSGLTVRVGREGFGVSLGISNIADVKGNRFSLGTPFAIGRDQVTPLRPRTVRLGIDAAW